MTAVPVLVRCVAGSFASEAEVPSELCREKADNLKLSGFLAESS